VSITDKTLSWIANGKVGASSKTMALCAAGIPENDRFGPSYPYDPADLNRCLLMMEDIPEVRLAFNKIAALSEQWGRLIEKWELIEETFLDEVGRDWCDAKSAPITYHLMKSVIEEPNEPDEATE
jgi:hypothetical protein